MNTIFTKSRVMKTLAVIALIVTCSNSYAQTYVPFPTENARWVAYQYIHVYFSRDYEIFTDGKKSINGIEYTRLTQREWVQRLNSSNQPDGNPVFSTGTYGFFRNDTLNEKIFLIRNGGTTESVWYDFKLQVGDTVNSIFDSSAFNGVTLTVLKVDSVLVNGSFRKRLLIEGACSAYIVGIGSTSGFGGFGICPFENDEYLICAQDDSSIVFGQSSSPCNKITSITERKSIKQFVEVFPNPTTDYLNLELNSNQNEFKEIVIRNYSGMEVLRVNLGAKSIQEIDVSNLANGFYIYQVVFKSDNATMLGSFVKN